MVVVHGLGRFVAPLGAVLAICAGLTGCLSQPVAPPPALPHELAKASMPTYVIEPPDILTIDAIRIVPKPPYKIEPLDELLTRWSVQGGNIPSRIAPDIGKGYGPIEVEMAYDV